MGGQFIEILDLSARSTRQMIRRLATAIDPGDLESEMRCGPGIPSFGGHEGNFSWLAGETSGRHFADLWFDLKDTNVIDQKLRIQEFDKCRISGGRIQRPIGKDAGLLAGLL